jgi:CheY-like chemotaxis protein
VIVSDRQIRVLHVDDEPALLDVTEQFLQQEDERIVVETATSPQEGLTLFEENSFDVVVSDYQMPEMDGLAFLETLRADDNQIPFIIFTGKGREEVAVDALNLGADRYLQKGGHPKSQYGLLADAVVQETEHRRARAELEASEERYRTLVEAFPDIVFITDYDSQMLWANDALERQTGLTIDDFQMDQEDNPFIHPEDADHVATRLSEFIESSRKYSERLW